MSSKDVIHFARTSFQKKADAQQVADKLTKVGDLTEKRHSLSNVSRGVIADLSLPLNYCQRFRQMM